MAMILDAFVGTVTKELAGLVEEKVVMILGVKDDLKKLQRRLERIQPVLQAAERRRIGNESINNWVKEMKDVMYDADDIIDLCRIEGAQLLDDQPSSSSSAPSVRCHFPLISCFTSVQLRHKLGKKIKSLNNRLNEITTDNYLFSNQFHLERTEPHLQVSGVNPRETSPVMVESDIVGREIQVATNNLVESLVREGSQTHCDIVAIVGMGGIGKTTLAQKIFNDRRVQSKFPIKVWVCVSKEFQETKLLREIIRQVGGDPRGAETKAELLPLLRDVVSGKSFFLVLDDVWSANVWVDLLRYSLQSGATTDSCRVLVTTRDVNVATTMGAMHIHRVQLLQLESGWELLSKSVFKNGEEEGRSLKDIGVQIVQKCRGLPLAIKVVAGLLIGKTRREWEDVLRNELWSMSALPEELRGALYLSYEDLPSHLKQCFLYLALFPEDYVYDRWDLVRMWVAEGFVERRGNKLMEDVAEDYYNELVRRNLLQPIPAYNFAKTKCKLHDLLRSLAQHLSREESFYGDPQELSTATTSIKLRRLSVSDNGEVAAIPESIMKQEGLRTLLLLTSPPRFENAVFARLSYLRVLLLNEKAIKSIADSLGELVHLRLLDLDRTSMSILPESIGRLTNLEILNLQGCQSLHTLPRAVTRLCNLRRLGLLDTPLSFVPKGIGRLEKLNDLKGFIVGADSSHQEHGCSLEELSPLSQLRELRIEKLERAQIRAGASSPLTNKPYFRRLCLACTPQTSREGGTTPYTEEDVNRIETVFEALLLPHSLEELYVLNFFGRQYPSWMMSPSLGTCLPYLTILQLFNCLSCPQLPPLGELPQLRYLRIEGASAVVTIGPEFLLKKTRPANLVAFPKLELLLFEEMPNWEEWSFGRDVVGEQSDDDNGGGGTASMKLDVLPSLQELSLTDCPKLGALPRGLQRSPIKRLFIRSAHSLKRVNSIPSLTDVLEIENNRCLEAISHLPALRLLNALECPKLKFVGNLDALQLLYLRDGWMECLPGWLITLLQQRQQNSLHDNLELYLDCNIRLLVRCLPGHEDWPTIQQIPRVAIYQVDGNGRLTYSKEPYSCETNVRI